MSVKVFISLIHVSSHYSAPNNRERKNMTKKSIFSAPPRGKTQEVMMGKQKNK